MNRGRPRTHDWCTIQACGGKHYAHGLCQRHYRAQNAKLNRASRTGAACTVSGCTDGRFRVYERCLAHTLEREFHERGGDDSMLPKETT